LPKPGTATPFKPPKADNRKIFSPLKNDSSKQLNFGKGGTSSKKEKNQELPSIYNNTSSPLILPDASKTFFNSSPA
jgi:hypothetical protein